jgi:AraC-like DNA-binding protein
MLFVITAESSVILSFAMINVLQEGFFDIEKYYLNLILVAVFSFLLIRSFWWDNTTGRIVTMIICSVLFVIQCGVHIHIFRKIYRQCAESLSNYYDEEEDYRLKRIKFCYVIMMLTQIFILVYLPLPRKFMILWILWYSLFFLYFIANFLSFVGSHKIMLDAFAYKTFTAVNLDNIKIKGRQIIHHQKKKVTKEKSKPENTIDFKNLEQELKKWVEQKKFSEYDKSRDDVAKELNTSRELLHMYFTTVKGIDFKTWRTELRIEEAKRLLLENKELSANVIGEIAGFSDRSNFYRQFVKLVGCSPKQWRESQGKI